MEKSWVMRLDCHHLEKRPCHEADIQGTRRSQTIKKCKRCKDGMGYPTVRPSDIPLELHGLSKDASRALWPLEPSTGFAV